MWELFQKWIRLQLNLYFQLRNLFRNNVCVCGGGTDISSEVVGNTSPPSPLGSEPMAEGTFKSRVIGGNAAYLYYSPVLSIVTP